MQKKYKIGFLGYGNLAKAICSGILGNIYKNDEVLVYSPSIEKLDKIDDLDVANSPKEIFNNCDVVILAVKPQVYRKEITKIINDVKCSIIISVMAGIYSREIQNLISNDYTRVYRTMPNTPCMVKKGVTAIEFIENNEDKNLIHNIFKSVGSIIEINEDEFDIISAITGSGPAFIELFMKSMIDVGVEKGINPKLMRKAVVDTFIGTATLVKNQNNVYMEDLIESVCSKGGMTIEGIDYMKSKDIDIIIKKGIKAAKKRSEELSSLNSK